MSAAQYFDLQSGHSDSHSGAVPLAAPALFRPTQIPGATNRAGEIRPVSVTLQEVMFTSRVPLSTWTFAFAVNDKLWVSDLTTLYFGKQTAIKRNIYRGKMFVPDRGGNLEIGITAYNSYGDLFNTSGDLHISANNTGNNGGVLIKIDEDWTQLLFNFQVQIEHC